MFSDDEAYVPPPSESESEDELDIMAASSPRAPTTAVRRGDRKRQTTVTSYGKRKRAKALSTGDVEGDAQKRALKMQKLDDKKAVTAIINLRRVAVDAARTRWLYRHRELFEPLLPSSSSFSANLQKDVGATGDKGVYVGLRPVEEQPKLVKGGTMKDYQLDGLAYLIWMYNNGMNCILGDEMGLGKTLQTLALFAHVKETSKGAQDPHLVICPLSVLSSWQAETARWVPSFRAVRFHGPAPERERLKNSFRMDKDSFDVCITTYEAFVAEENWFKSRRWTYCVLDEGHKIKNSETNLSHRVQGIGSMFRLLLTGTPVQNNLVELWGLLHWLYPNVFTNATEYLFKRSFDLEHGKYSLPFISAAQNLLSTVMLRRTKANVEVDVPPRETLTVFLPFTELQRFWTYKLLTRMDSLDLEQIFTTKINPEDDTANEGRREVLAHLENQMRRSSIDGKQGNQWKKLMNLLMQLRQVCDHPYLLPDVEPVPFVIGEHIVAGSSKLIAIDKLLAEILPTGERVLIFSQWTGMLDLLEDFMTLRSIRYARLDGSTSRPRRALDIKLFQQENSPYQVFLVSTKAGGLGINLTKATTVIMCDSDWNPQNDLQAIARAHRIGQTKVVKVYQLICHGSVEDQMLDRIRRKLFLSVKVMGSDNPSTSENSTLRSSELMDILRRGSSALSNSNDGMDLVHFLDAKIGDILQYSRSREEVRVAKMKQEVKDEIKDEADAEMDRNLLKDAEEEEKRLLSGIAQVRCRLFEGKMVNRARDNKEIATEWKELQKRARVDKIVMVGGMPMIAVHIMPEVVQPIVKPVKQKKRKFESEDWCIYCRDGGELMLCQLCPRVFHAKCRGISKKTPMPRCSQHICSSCERTTSEAGGMLFRCQTCPHAFCEDCLPDEELHAIGDVLPEFELLGYGQKATSYFIRCRGCKQHFIDHPEDLESWQEEERETQAKLESQRFSSVV